MTIISKNVPEHKRFCLRQIHGNCLERLGVMNEGGGYAIIDCNAQPREGDIVHCSEIPGQINGVLKQVKEINGDSIIVGTAYNDKSKDYTFEAAEIYGVVTETYGAIFGFREYVRDEPIFTLEEVNPSVRTYNCLKRSGINTLNELSDYSEMDLKRVRNLGPKCYEEVIELCKLYGISLKGSKEE